MFCWRFSDIERLLPRGYASIMSFNEVIAVVPRLTFEERQILIRLALELDDPPLSAGDGEMAEERLAEHHADPSSSVPLDEMKIYHVEVSPALISSVTDEVIEEVKTWQNRQLDAVYPIIYLDAIQFKVRDSGHVKNKAIYLAIGVTIEGLKEVLGLWIAQTEDAKFWLQVGTERKNP